MRALIWLLFGAAIIAVISWFVDGNSTIDRFRFYKFDQTDWSRATASQRYFMAQFLIDENKLLDLSHAGTTELLGPPDSQSGQAFVYKLGHRRSLEDSADPRLIIVFDNNKVKEASFRASSS